jgi:hypothetical protein
MKATIASDAGNPSICVAYSWSGVSVALCDVQRIASVSTKDGYRIRGMAKSPKNRKKDRNHGGHGISYRLQIYRIWTKCTSKKNDPIFVTTMPKKNTRVSTRNVNAICTINRLFRYTGMYPSPNANKTINVNAATIEKTTPARALPGSRFFVMHPNPTSRKQARVKIRMIKEKLATSVGFTFRHPDSCVFHVLGHTWHI